MQSEESKAGVPKGGKSRWIEGLVVGIVAIALPVLFSFLSLVLRGIFSWPGFMKLTAAELVMAGVGYAMGSAWIWCSRRFGRIPGFVAMLLLVVIWVPLIFTLPWHWVAHPPELSANRARDLATNLPWLLGIAAGGRLFPPRGGASGGTAQG